MGGVRTNSTLTQPLKRLMLFRVVMITTLLLVAVYVEAISETLRRQNPLYLIIAASYLLTIVYAVAMHFLPVREWQVYSQITLDLVTITGLVYLTGGTGLRTSFILLYPISILSGSVLLRGKGPLLSALATILYGSMLWAVRAGWVSAGALQDVPLMETRHIVYSVFVTGVACATVAFIGSYLSESLKSAGERLEEAAGQVADLRELNDVIVNSIQSGLLTADANGRILHINEFGERLLGRKNAELQGQTLREAFGSPVLDGPALEARAGHERLARLEVSYKGPTRQCDLGVSVSRLATSDPKTRGFLLVFQDLTEIKRLEQEVRIKEKLAAVGEMAAHLAHEIRNPLGSISGSAQVLMTEPNISSGQAQLLAIITRESKRLSASLNQFLFQTRPSPSLGPVDVGRLIGEAVALLRNGPEVRAHHALEFEVDGGPHVCLADPDQITQVFWNLARNGLEAMPDGGVLRVRLSSRAGNLILAVRDQGRGMEREEQRRIFKPFHSGMPMGTGLGLAIVYQIVKEHRGDITVHSAPAEGTEVEVRLPLVPLPVPA